MNTSRRPFLSVLALGLIPASVGRSESPNKKEDPVESDAALTARFERRLKEVQREIAAMKTLTENDIVGAHRTLRIASDEVNVKHVFLLQDRSTYLELCWWNSSDASTTRMAILLALKDLDRDDDGAPCLYSQSSMFNESQRKMRETEVKLVRQNKEKWQAIAAAISESAGKLRKAYGEKAK
jgi:hypothetical protein